MVGPNPSVPAAELRPFHLAAEWIAVNHLWEVVAPDVHRFHREKVTKALLERGCSSNELKAMAKQVLAMNGEDRKCLADMMEKGFQPEQVALFAMASPSERQEFARSWLPSSPIPKFFQRMEEGGNTLSIIRTGGVAVAVLMVAVAGVISQNSDIVQSAAVLADGEGLPASNPLSIAGVGTAMVFGGMLLKTLQVVASESFRKPVEPQMAAVSRDLEDRISGIFRRTGLQEFPLVSGTTTEKKVMDELAAVPRSYLPLLTHLHPKELVVFLSGEDAARSDMMRRHPPETNQRVLCSRAMSNGRFHEFSSALQQPLSGWARGMETENAVTLDKSLKALREERAARREQQELPPARPDFSASLPKF